MRLIINLTKNLDFNAESYLYWIRRASHTEISTEGYVGISSSPNKRINQHNACLSSLSKARDQGYSSEFIKAYHEEDLFFEIVNCGTMASIQNQEYLLRPAERVGWNVAIGGLINGVCSRYKHGGTSNMPMYNKFNSVLKYCMDNELPIDSNFKTDSGFKLFQLHVDDDLCGKNVKQTKVRLRVESLGLTLGNFFIESLSVNSDHDKWVFFEDRWWSKKEACFKTGVDIKTANKRLTKYKMSREESVGFVQFTGKAYEIVYLNGVPCKYNKKISNFSKQELHEMYDFYKKGVRGFKQFCSDRGVEEANMIRYFKRYGLNTKTDRRSKEFRDAEVIFEY